VYVIVEVLARYRPDLIVVPVGTEPTGLLLVMGLDPGSTVLADSYDQIMAEYRRPFAKSQEDRWPTLAWPREIPIDGEPPSVVALVAAYAGWMAENDLPKLFVNAEPGAILTGPQREFCRSWPNQTEVTVKGSHFIQEDSGPEIGRAIAAWCSRHVIPSGAG
jgi:haloalkane dehalogenase